MEQPTDLSEGNHGSCDGGDTAALMYSNWDCQIFCVRAGNGLRLGSPCFYQVGLINRSPYRIVN